MWLKDFFFPILAFVQTPGTEKQSVIPISVLILLEKRAQKASLHCLDTARRGFYVPSVTEKSLQTSGKNPKVSGESAVHVL